MKKNMKRLRGCLVVSVVGLLLYLSINPFLKGVMSTSGEVGKLISENHKILLDTVGVATEPLSNSNKSPQQVAEPNFNTINISAINKKNIPKPSTGIHDSSEREFEELLSDAIPSTTVDFIIHDPEAFGYYSRLLNKARELRSEDSITEFLDCGLTFLDELKLNEISYEDTLFILDFCKQISNDLKTFELIASPEFMQVAQFRILLARYTLPRERATLVDYTVDREEFYRLTKLTLKDPILERQRRYLLFMAQIEGMHRLASENGVFASDDYYNYGILREVLDLPPIGSDASIRAQITATKIDIAANIEYARRDFISSSKDTPNEYTATQDEDTLAQYEQTLSRYKEKIAMVDILVKNFGDELEEGDRLYIATLKKRATNDQRRMPWNYMR